METKVNYAIVGAFVITLLAATILMIVWLSSGLSNHKEYKTYLVYMNESVSGLNIESPVKYNGVDVGYVKKIRLNPDNPQQVEVLVNIEANAPITEDTRATLNVQGLTGIAFLGLKNVGTSTRSLTIQPGQKYPVIQNVPSILTRLDTALSDLTTNLTQITKSIQSVLDPENQLAFKETLHNLSIVTNSLADSSKNMTAIMQNTSKASQQFPTAMQMFVNQTLPATNQLLNSLQIVSDNMIAISSDLKQNPSIVIRGKTPPPLGPGEK